ncbi:MAG TPA: nitroreductase family protein [Armatimonadota bacterium]|jgi:nitroreductase
MAKPAKTDNPIHEILVQRWSPRAFTAQPVSEEDLRSILEAARWAASSFNEQPWRYIVATRDRPEQFARVLECLVPANQAWARNAQVLMLGVVKETFTHNDAPNRSAAHDLGAASANMTFEATARGLAVHQMGGILPDKAREVFGIPEGFHAATAIAIGYEGDPATLPEAYRASETDPRTRRPLDEIAFGDTWGAPVAALSPAGGSHGSNDQER